MPSVPVELVVAAAVADRHRAGVEIDRAQRQLPGANALRQFVQQGEVGRRFDHQIEDAAAGQAEAVRLVRCHPVALEERLGAVELAGGHADDQVVLDAAAGNRALHPAVVAQRHPRPGRTRRRAPGVGHGDEGEAVALIRPATDRRQHFAVLAVHAQAASSAGLKGRRVRCLPVAAAMALATAGAAGGTPGSPMPVGAALEGTICTSTTGISWMRSGG